MAGKGCIPRVPLAGFAIGSGCMSDAQDRWLARNDYQEGRTQAVVIGGDAAYARGLFIAVCARGAVKLPNFVRHLAVHLSSALRIACIDRRLTDGHGAH